MSTRQLRRAEARRAAKEATRQIQEPIGREDLLTPAPGPDRVGQRPNSSFDSFLNNTLSLAQLEANRANAWKSTGPRTETGKRISSMNAVKTGLTGKTVLLPCDDATAYERHVQRFFSDLKPVGDRESELVQLLADAQWRLNRIPGLEMGIYALGRLEFADVFSAHDPEQANLLLESYIFMRRQKELKNLALQESRLRRHYQKDAAELADLQQKRLSTPTEATQCSRDLVPDPTAAVSCEPDPDGKSRENGFVFSTEMLTTRETRLVTDSESYGDRPDFPIAA